MCLTILVLNDIMVRIRFNVNMVSVLSTAMTLFSLDMFRLLSLCSNVVSIVSVLSAALATKSLVLFESRLLLRRSLFRLLLVLYFYYTI